MTTNEPDRLERESINREIVQTAFARILGRYEMSEEALWQSRKFTSLKELMNKKSSFEIMRNLVRERGLTTAISLTCDAEHCGLIIELLTMIRETPTWKK